MFEEQELREIALTAALETDFHGSVDNLIKTAQAIYDWMVGG